MRRRRGLIAAAVLAIFILSWPPLAWLFLQPLEAWYPQSRYPPALDADAIVVLSSGILAPSGSRPAPFADLDTYERCTYAAWLYHHARPMPVLVTGGMSGDLPESAAAVMRRVLIGEGVPDASVWIEGRAHSTYENAVYSAEILRRHGVHRILLVTAAYHMARSERCFRKQGLSVIPAPCAFHTMRLEPSDLIPDGEAILDQERSLHEYIGLAWYALRGRI